MAKISSFLLLLVALAVCHAFLSPTITSITNERTCSSLILKDKSSANVFQIGNRVKVVDNVEKAGVDLKNRIGIGTHTICPIFSLSRAIAIAKKMLIVL